MELWTRSQREWLQACAHMGHVVVDVTREAYVASLGWQTCWPVMFHDPIGWYERSVRETVENKRRAVDLVSTAGTTMSELAERWTASSKDARHRMEEAYFDVDPSVRRRPAA